MNKGKRTRRPLRRLPSSIVLRGREFTRTELKTIRNIVKLFENHGRTRISEEVCKALNWRQPNGWLKDRACRDIMRKLAAARLIRLPKMLIKRRVIASRLAPPVNCKSSSTQEEPITAISGPITLRLAKGNADETTWNVLVQRYHYLGHKVIVGKCLKFLVLSGETIISAISFSEAAWAVADRDRSLQSLGIAKHEVANNSRFLILPHVKVKNLASTILALSTKRVLADWHNYYSIRLKALETFVDSSRFQGTCYLAANWLHVGTTQGYRKSGANHFNSQTPKFVFLYPVDPKARTKLRETSASGDANATGSTKAS